MLRGLCVMSLSVPSLIRTRPYLHDETHYDLHTSLICLGCFVLPTASCFMNILDAVGLAIGGNTSPSQQVFQLHGSLRCLGIISQLFAQLAAHNKHSVHTRITSHVSVSIFLFPLGCDTCTSYYDACPATGSIRGTHLWLSDCSEGAQNINNPTSSTPKLDRTKTQSLPHQTTAGYHNDANSNRYTNQIIQVNLILLNS